MQAVPRARPGPPLPPIAAPTPPAVPAEPSLDGLIAVAAALRTGADLEPTLDAVCRSIAASLGVGCVAINRYRPAFHDFEVGVVHGSDRARETLLGIASPAEEWAMLIDDRFDRRGAYFIPHDGFDWGAIEVSYVPEIEASSDPDAWHPEDALFVPLRSSTGAVLGIMSIDEPDSGRRPTDRDLDVLVAAAAQAGLVLESAELAQDALRHRADVQHLLRVSSRLTREHSPAGIARAVCDGIRDALGFERVIVGLLGD